MLTTAPQLPTLPTSGIDPLTGRVKNYRVKLHSFGSARRGQVVSRAAVLRSAGAGAVGNEAAILAEAVRSGRFEETYDACTESAPPPPAAKVLDARRDVEREKQADVDYFRSKAERLQRELDEAQTALAAAQRLTQARDREIQRQALEMADLREQIDGRDALIANLKREIEAAAVNAPAAASAPAIAEGVS